ncbi:nuclear transport factor 2 family protein, partial [Klebsiella pneumoniae]|nr:nuclear transport factor 2 family protein [Klebsiella pneumoniae]
TLRSSIWQRSHICTNHQKCWQLRFHQGTPVKDVQEEGQARKMAN